MYSNYLLLVLTYCILVSDCFVVSTSYPKCETYPPTSWTEIGPYVQGSAITTCKNNCRTQQSTTLAGVRRVNINAGKAKCFCGDIADIPIDQEQCSWKCEGGQQCGGPNSMSVYPVCDPGKRGTNCQTDCPGSCDDNVCDVDTGVCHGACADNLYGAHCNISCSANCKDGCVKDTGDCNSCVDGFYGNKCDQNCSNCGNDKCDQANGKCDGECKDGWYKSTCDIQCPKNCSSPKTCNIDNGACDGGCADGWYGSHCNISCPTKCNGGCGKNTGDCTSCVDGYYGTKCDTQCPAKCNQTICDFNAGSCTFQCVAGFYGTKCTEACPVNCQSDICDFHNGTCTNQCKPGHYGQKCTIPCPDNCQDKLCDFTVGNCTTGCVDGHYGNHYCNENCPPNCAGNVCAISDGVCTSGCVSGWNGTRCTVDIDECADEKLHNCTAYGPEFKCQNLNGSYTCCSGSEDGKEICIEDPGPSGPNIAIIAGVCVAVLVVIGIVVTLVILYLRKRPKKDPRHNANEFTNAGFVDSAAQDDHNHVARIQHKSVVSIDVDYENFNGDNSNRTCSVTALQGYVDMNKKIEDFFRKEFESLPTETLHPWDDARREEVSKKNRFKGIYPYNHTRVMLDAIDGQPGSDYINASWIEGYFPDERFIAALGPREKSMDDFWRMVWQEKVTAIVMLTNLTEAGVDKCDQYWPKGNTAKYGDITVMIKREDVRPTNTTRKLRIQKDDEIRAVTHYHYTVWPDHGVPPDATALLNYRRKVISTLRPNVPIVIHCSAGVGRTGTLIALDYLIKQAEAEGKINVFGCVEKLRHQRKHMVQTTDQYVFLHEALVQYIRVGNTTFDSSEFSSKYREWMELFPGGPIRQQYELLQDLAPKLAEFDKENALSAHNKAKNRYQDILPSIYNGVYLTSRIKGRNDYINAVRVDGFQNPDAYHVTQFPLEDTVIDFWRMIQDGDSNAIVILMTTGQAKEAYHFLPAKNRPMDIMDSVAYVRSSMTKGPYRSMDIYLGDKDENNQYMNMDDISKLPIKDAKALRVFEITVAEDQECLDPGIIIDVFKELQQWRIQTGNKKVTVTCLNGALYSGQFVGCCNMFEMINTDQEMDVYQVTKYIRDSRPQFINTIDQYRAMYDTANLYLKDFGTYANA